MPDLNIKLENLENQLIKTNCVIFDMDGVIIDSEFLHKKAYYETFISLGLDVSDELYRTLTGSSTINVFQNLISQFNIDDDPEILVLEKRKRYVNYFENDPTLRLVGGVEDLIKFFYQKGLTLVLASSSSMPNIDRVFNRFQLNQYFLSKVSGADLEKSKPDPEIFNKAAALANIPKDQCIVIEDSDNGVEAANKAGIFAIGFDNPLSENQSLEKADVVISNFNQLRSSFLKGRLEIL